MTLHRYAVGDTVSLNFHEGQFFSKLDPFTIEATMPHLGDHLQYRIKSKQERCCRMVAEHQLSAFGSQPETAPVIHMGSSPPNLNGSASSAHVLDGTSGMHQL